MIPAKQRRDPVGSGSGLFPCPKGEPRQFSEEPRSIPAVPFLTTRWLNLLLLGALLAPAPAGAAPAEAFPGQNRKWAYYESPNFELYSANDERDSRDILEKMELLRAVFLETFKLIVRLPQPVTIYAFDRQKDFNGYVPHDKRGEVEWAGFCQSSMDRSVIMLAPARDRDNGCETVYHEYVHYLFRIAEQNPAPWFNEGMAELFSTMQDDDKWLELGGPVAGRVYDLRAGRMMPLEQLFAVTPDSPVFKNSGHTGIFYAESWAFLHYCRFGENRFPREKLDLFLRAAGSPKMQGKPAEFRALTRELLGRDYPELLEDLHRYITNGSFRGRKVPRPVIAPKASYLTRPAPPEEMGVRLAELSLRYTQGGQAKLAILQLLDRKPDARLHELLGAMAMQENEPDVAREHWNSAIELGTANPAVFRELSGLEASLVFNNFELDYQMPAERAVCLRTLLNRSILSAPEQSVGYEMLAWVEAMSTKPDIANINLIQQRFGTLNDKPRTLLALAVVRLRRGEAPAALGMLDKLDKLGPDDWVKYCAEVTRARLEQRPVNPQKLQDLLSGRSTGVKITLPNLDLPH